MNLAGIREAICEIGRRVYQRGWVASNDGNISARLGPNEFLISPSGVSKGSLTPDGLMLVDAQGSPLNGGGKVSTEWRMHQKIYERRPEIGGVVHTHAPHATAFAVAGLALDLPVLPELVYGLGAVPLVPYALPGSGELYEAIDPFVGKADALLLKNHGLVTCGKDVWAAYFHHESVEHSALIQILASQIGNVDTLTRAQVAQLKAARDAAGLTTPWLPPRFKEGKS
jgi:L-fuculose-phosphate aldolase